MKILGFITTILFFMVSYTVNAENSASNSQLIEITVMDNHFKSDTLTVQGKCGMCKTRIEKAVKLVKDVSSASWDIETKKLRVSYDPAKTSIEAISKAIAKAGQTQIKTKPNKRPTTHFLLVANTGNNTLYKETH